MLRGIGIFTDMKVLKTCRSCGKSFLSYDVGERILNTCCSVKCAALRRVGERVERELRKCPMCPTEFRILGKLSKTYCSKKCQHKSLIKLDHLSEEEKLALMKNKYERFVVKKEGCWDWKGATQKRYGCFNFLRKNLSAHRASWILYNGSISADIHVLHKCDNPPCTNPEHLFLGSHRDNMRDMRTKGLHKQYSKITKDQAKEIKLLLSQGEKMQAISERYGLSLPSLCDIKAGRTWKSIQ